MRLKHSILDRIKSSITTTWVEERVEVNQKHLVHKMLARYSSEYFVYRELMQNADDASSKTISIKFLTSGGTHEKSKFQIIFKNDGHPFRLEDWNRLKSIAEGNPDEKKIGAFGVGFYSVFSICDNPMVTSGAKCMSFEFRGDQLFTKRADLPMANQDQWTTFVMEISDPANMPKLDDFARFLTTSLSFTANLREIEVYENDNIVFSLKKRLVKTRPMNLSDDFIKTSPQNMFTVNSVEISDIQLDAEKIPTSSNQTNNEVSPGKATTILRIVNGNLDVRVPEKIERGMEARLKKTLPKQTTFSLIFTGKEEFDASEKHNIIFKDLIAYPNQGRVFIGFPMSQTTGCASHMAARFIPTVERDAIDFTDPYIGKWNMELLTIGGLLCRIVYEDELEQVGKLLPEQIVKSVEVLDDDSEQTQLKNRVIHAMLTFSFKESTPSPMVGQVQETNFLKMARQAPLVITSHGIVRGTEARMPDPELSEFVRTIPVVPTEIVEQCGTFLNKWEDVGPLKMSIKDIFDELRARVLMESEMVFLLRWWINYNASNAVTEHTRSDLLDLAIINATKVPLSQIRFWLNPKIVPPNMPLPKTVLPYEISKNLKPEFFAKVFPTWRELSLLEWSQFIVTNPDLEIVSVFAEKVLGVISRALPTLSAQNKRSVIALFAKKKCIHTKQGMKLPVDAYFPNVKVFDDLPIIVNPKILSEELLTALKVKKNVDLQLIFNRLVANGSWSHIKLIKYLTSIEARHDQIARLRVTTIFPKEGEKQQIVKSADGKEVKKIIRYKATDLYAPLDVLRELGLPVLDYKDGKWHSRSREAKFLIDVLGLQKHPPLDIILKISANSHDKVLQARALSYFIEYFEIYKSFYDAASVDHPFLPCADCKTFATPSDCFLNPVCEILGFNIIHQDHEMHAAKLGVAHHPSVEVLLNRFLGDIKTDCEKAVKIFEYMASRVGDFQPCHWDTLRGKKFIPVPDKKSPDGFRLVDSSQCFFESDEPNPDEAIFKELLTYINFGSDAARRFLRACDVETKPRLIDLAQMITDDPERAYTVCGGDRYLTTLRKIAEEYDSIKQRPLLVEKMRDSPFLVGVKKVNTQPLDVAEAADSVNEGNGDDKKIVQYVLARPKDIFINDDSIANQVFAPITSPIEPLLEKFYKAILQIFFWVHFILSILYLPFLNWAMTGIGKLAAVGILEDNPQQGRKLLHDEEWLKANLKVQEVTQIEITRTFTCTGDKNTQSTLACLDQAKYTIYISEDSVKDYYDISTCLSRIIFSRSSFNDNLIVQQYLTADLSLLRSRGVPIDRILKQKKAPEHATGPVEVISPSPEPQVSKALQPTPKQQQDLTPAVDHQNLDKFLAQMQNFFPGVDRELLAQETREIFQRVSKLMNQPPGGFLNKDSNSLYNGNADASRAGTNNGATPNGSLPSHESNSRPAQSHHLQLPMPSQTFSPEYYKDVKENLRRSIEFCKPTVDASVSSTPEHTIATEPQARYCDGRVIRSLKLAHVEGMEFYVRQDSNADDLHTYSKPLQQFHEVLKGLMQVFTIPAANIHVYYENGSTIAFNQECSLFFNLYYYVELNHGGGDKTEAMIYWFMTICHELAHNIELNHNSDHEFYMSSFAEGYLKDFIDHLKKQG
ncbi:hypothetical protein BC938DRAFT_476673 [Jimgerdemannia flammicorona]|uniref:Sacsin/Nov domain-containing protein n=1 Tax=Jimgerdemannia flammicorona TaxID=994334 RepID=A0A433QZ20_9FUNG|nr:hypothetical protein BC938DRAFT_476673 [Jimgerdemannia flammicorona]